MGRSPAIVIKGLVKRFGNITAVDGLDLEIYDNELFVLLGPNGSGKTTTLLVISTVYKPTSGDVLVYGYSVAREGDQVRKLIGIAFQEPKALWMDTPYDILLWHALAVGYSLGDARKVVREVMDELGLWEHRGKMISELSGGTRKKVEVAKVLIQKPRVAIFDEPTAQLDVVTKHAVWNKIMEMKREGSTIIVATNDMNEAEKLAERIGIIHKGKLRALGTVAQLKDSVPGGDVVELELDSPASPDIQSLLKEKLRVPDVRVDRASLRLYVNKGEEVLAEAVSLLNSLGYKVKRASLKEPTLDDVFFYYTGASLREGVGAS
ncbi:MAG: ABC transporter ATP-binding protein [Acidilobaceae archaeon]